MKILAVVLAALSLLAPAAFCGEDESSSFIPIEYTEMPGSLPTIGIPTLDDAPSVLSNVAPKLDFRRLELHPNTPYRRYTLASVAKPTHSSRTWAERHRFQILEAAKWAAIVADLKTTSDFMDHGVREAGPAGWVGLSHNKVGVIVFAVATEAAASIWNYKLRKKNKARLAGELYTVGSIYAHTVYAATN